MDCNIIPMESLLNILPPEIIKMIIKWLPKYNLNAIFRICKLIYFLGKSMFYKFIEDKHIDIPYSTTNIDINKLTGKLIMYNIYAKSITILKNKTPPSKLDLNYIGAYQHIVIDTNNGNVIISCNSKHYVKIYDKNCIELHHINMDIVHNTTNIQIDIESNIYLELSNGLIIIINSNGLIIRQIINIPMIKNQMEVNYITGDIIIVKNDILYIYRKNSNYELTQCIKIDHNGYIVFIGKYIYVKRLLCNIVDIYHITGQLSYSLDMKKSKYLFANIFVDIYGSIYVHDKNFMKIKKYVRNVPLKNNITKPTESGPCDFFYLNNC